MQDRRVIAVSVPRLAGNILQAVFLTSLDYRRQSFRWPISECSLTEVYPQECAMASANQSRSCDSI